MPASESRPQSPHRRSLDRLATSISGRNPQDITRPLPRSRSSDGLDSLFAQPTRRQESTSTPRRRSLSPRDTNTVSEPQPLDRSALPALPALERGPRDTQRLPPPTEIWTPSSAPSDTIQSPDNAVLSLHPYEPRPIYQGRISDFRRRGDIDEITPVVPFTSYRPETFRLETFSGDRDSVGEGGSNQTNDQDALLKAMGVTKYRTFGEAEMQRFGKVIMDVVTSGGDKRELLRRIEAESAQILQERDQVNDRDVATLLKALGIKEDLSSGNYLAAQEHAQTIVRVIRTDGQDSEFNKASGELLKLAPKRFWLRSLVNPKKDTIDWYSASWRNQHAMSKLDTKTWTGSFRKLFYRANQPIAGLTNTRSGNLAFIGLQAIMGTAYTSYIEKGFASSTFESSLEYAATARFFYSLLPNPINQLIDTIQFQGVSIGLYQAQNATSGG
jgi:hypothetical protein